MMNGMWIGRKPLSWEGLRFCVRHLKEQVTVGCNLRRIIEAEKWGGIRQEVSCLRQR